MAKQIIFMYTSRVLLQKLEFRILVAYHLQHFIFIRIHMYLYMCVCIPCIIEFCGSHGILYTIEKPHIWNELIPTQSHWYQNFQEWKKKPTHHCTSLSETLSKMSKLRPKTFTFPQITKPCVQIVGALPVITNALSLLPFPFHCGLQGQSATSWVSLS